ncbi:MAG: hypothetical protein JW722_08230 [Demequinaceae bacterium]|nr:hypothetical protein [Demequinaceae bacterium]
MSDMGPAERQVRSAKVRTMEFNHCGQYSILMGLGVSLVPAASLLAGGFYPQWVMFGGALFLGVVGGLLYLAVKGFSYGVRGYKASKRGLATNRGTSMMGILLTSVMIAWASVGLIQLFF